jgi:hypothetical protein
MEIGDSGKMMTISIIKVNDTEGGKFTTHGSYNGMRKWLVASLSYCFDNFWSIV